MKARIIVLICVVGTLVCKAQTENPQGLYRLQRFGYDGRHPDREAPFEQYKYCSPIATLTVSVLNRSGSKLNLNMGVNDKEPLLFTGQKARGEDGRGTQVYDSNKDHFTMRWYNSTNNSTIFPPNEFIDEFYDAKKEVEDDVRKVFDMLETPVCKASKKRTVEGCWRCVGLVKEMEGKRVISSILGLYDQQPQYYIFKGNDALLMTYNYSSGSRYATQLTLAPFLQPKKNKINIPGVEYTIEWIDDSTIILSYSGMLDVTTSTLWVRSFFPFQLDEIFYND